MISDPRDAHNCIDINLLSATSPHGSVFLVLHSQIRQWNSEMSIYYSGGLRISIVKEDAGF